MDKLPMDIIKHILSYDTRYVIRNGNIIVINQIDKTLPIYELLSQKPKIIASKNVNGSPDYFSALVDLGKYQIEYKYLQSELYYKFYINIYEDSDLRSYDVQYKYQML